MTFKYSIGSPVEKFFAGHGWFAGKVVSRRQEKDSSCHYKIVYEDDDEEEVVESELSKIIVTGEETTTTRRRSKRNQTRAEEKLDMNGKVGMNNDHAILCTPSSTPECQSKRPNVSIATKTTKARGITPSPVTSMSHEEEDGYLKTSTEQVGVHTRMGAARKRKAAASIHGPAKSRHFDATTKSNKVEEDSDFHFDDEWDQPLSALVKRASPSKTKVAAKRKIEARVGKETDVKNDAGKKKPSAKSKMISEKTDSVKKRKNEKLDSTCSQDTKPKLAKSGPPLILAEDSDSDDEKDRPFRVEYSASSRSTCRSCDHRIEKGEIRICSRPLFRGNPGFVTYRHLQCQILPEEIRSISDVGGWRRLKAEDRDRLAKRVDDSKLQIEQENEELHADELVQASFQGELRKPPSGLAATLLPFQQEGVSWMYNQEVNVEMMKGGILADEMGMGKTIQTIACILDNRPKLQHSKPGCKHPPGDQNLDALTKEEALWDQAMEECHHDLEMAGVPKSFLKVTKKKGNVPIGVRAGTLVVVPLIAIYQWQGEIEKFTEENALSVCVYHGSNRHAKFPREILCKYDVILTTYQVLEADFRKMVSPNKVTCPNCGRKFKIDKLAVHLKYFCGETAHRTEAQARQRRTADRHQRPSHDSGRDGKTESGGKSRKKSLEQKHTKLATKTKKTDLKDVEKKKTVRAIRSRDYETDSDLSVPEDLDVSVNRPLRSAAKLANKKLALSSKEWAGDSLSGSDASVQSEQSEEDIDNTSIPPQTKATSRYALSQSSSSTSENSETNDDSGSEDDEALARARKRQKVALTKIKQSKKRFGGGKTTFDAVKAKVPNNNQSLGKKKIPRDGDPSNDPLASVDMEALKAEALEGCAVSVLHTMCFWRIVLDEAHMIKSRSSQTASAAFHLSSVHRWALSGTPLQNRVGELYSLIRFLRLDPIAHYFCRRDECNCKSIYYRMEFGKCKDCGHASSQHFSYFNKHILNVIQSEGYTGDGRRAMMKLKAEVLDKCLLRRTKESRAEDMNLPPRVVTIKPIRLHPREEDFYNALYTESKSSFDDYVAEGSILNNYAHVFDLLTKMRQAVDHPYLIVHSKKAHALKSLSREQQGGQPVANGSTVCEMCEETPTDRVLSSCCGSAFCRSCVLDLMSLENLRQAGGLRCISCRQPFTIDLNQTQNQVEDDSTLSIAASKGEVGIPSLREMSHVASGSILRRIDLAEFSTSTKVESLVQELVQMRQERQGSKALVFSQFVNMLDLVRWRLHSDPCLQDLGLGVRIIHGGMNVQSRDEALKDFREDPTIRVLLMSLKAGGVALNLTVANEAYLLDPWWNPAAEMQAIDRTHRLGQYRPIRAVRFIAEGTVEERVLQLQEKKRLVFDGTVGRDAASLKMLTVEDMKALFT